MSTAPVLRRRTDRPFGLIAVPAVRSLVTRIDAVTGGRLLLLSTGTVVMAATPLLGPTANDWYAVLTVSAVMVALLVASALPDWSQLPREASVLFPLSAVAALASIGLAAPHLAVALTGLLTAACVYTGLTQRPGSSALLVPLACATFLVMNGGPSHAVVVRMLVSAMVWTLIIEVLALFSRQHQRLTHALERAAMSDPLTGLPNRRDLDVRLASVRPGDALVLCDLDHFKRLNDAYGHRAGDRVLADFGTLLRLELREGDYCARYGGEEFVLHLPGTSPAEASAALARLRVAWQRMNAETTFSTGIAACERGRPIGATLAGADNALYEAKAAGRNTDCIEALDTAAR